MSYYEKRARVHNTGGYDDKDTREAGIQFMDEVKGIKMISNPVDKKIDLVTPDGTFGVDVEQARTDDDGNGGSYVNYWNKYNHGRNTVSNMGFPTVNMPWWRKYNYYTPVLDDFLYDPNWEVNAFLRFTTDLLCATYVSAKTIQDRKKCLDSKFKTSFVTTGFPEIWKSFRREDVETYVRKDLNSPWILFGIDEIPEEPKEMTEEERKQRVNAARERRTSQEQEKININ